MPIRLPMLTLLLLTASPHGQSQTPVPLPRSPQTAPASRLPAITPITAATPAPPPAPLTPAQSPARRATISYTAGQLSISASNSSLNQILREVSRLTGIKITGGVAEERVFGNYGPAEPADVLGKLLDGTASNVLFVADAGDKTPELILSPRTGGVTPPNPNAASFDDNADSDDAPRPAATPAAQLPESQSQPARENPVAAPIPPPRADSDTPNPTPASTPPANATPQESPNGVKTPQQIYDELMRLRRQQQAQPQ